MKPPVGGMSHKELHGSGSALTTGGPGERAHSMHSPSVSEGSADERSDIRSANRSATNADQNYQMESMQSGSPMTAEGHARARNQGYYNAAQEGSASGARQVRDTDEVIASSRGDAPGSEYTENDTGEAQKVGLNMAPGENPVKR